ncbi:hypothetical protein MHYP_G00184020 [Metynnis hypsauchen]
MTCNNMNYRERVTRTGINALGLDPRHDWESLPPSRVDPAASNGLELDSWCFPVDRHNNQSHEKIRHSQREDKQVGWSVELLEVRNGDDHQQVQKHSEHRYT